MTQSEVAAKMKDLSGRRVLLTNKVVNEARAVVAVLKDAGRFHTAEPLAALYFELDALDQEMLEFVKTDLEVIVDLLKGLK